MNNLLDGSALLPTPPPDDATAYDLIQKYDTATPEEQASIAPQLKAYTDAQDAKKRGENNLKWQQIYSDPKTLGGHINAIKDDPALTHSTTPDETASGAANMAYLSDTTGKSMDELAQNWPAIRSGYAIQNHGKDVKSDKELFGLISQEVARKKASSDSIGKLPGDAVVQAFQDVVTGKDTSTLDTFNAWKDQHPDIVRDYPEATLHKLYSDLYSKTAQLIAPLAPQAKAIFDSLAKDTGRPDATASAIDPAQLASQIQDLPPAQKQALYTIATVYAERTGQSKGFWTQIGESIGRTVTGTVGSVSLAAKQNEIQGQLDLLKSEEAAIMPDGSIIPLVGAQTQTAQEFTTPTEEQKTELTAKLQEQLKGITTVRELNALASQQIDPIKPVVDWMPRALESGLYAAAGSLPLVATSLLQPEVGLPAVGAAIFGQEFHRIALAYPNLPTSQINTMAALSAAPQTALMNLRAKAILGKLPVLGNYLQKLGNPQMNPFLRAGINTIGQSAEQGAMNMVQSAVPLMVDGLAKAAGADMPEYDLGKALEAYKDSTPEILFSVLPFALIGAGVATHSDIRRGEAMTRNSQALREMGYSIPEAERISKIEDPEKRTAEIRATWKNRTPEDIKTGAELITQRIAGDVKNQADPATPTLRSEDEMVNGTPTGNKIYTVLDEQGNQKIQTTDPEAALHYYQTAQSDAASNERSHLKSLVEYFQGLDQSQGRERTYLLDTKHVTAADEVSAGQSPEQLKERMEQEGIRGGTPLDQVIIRGKTIPDLSRQIYSDTIQILDGQAGTLFHERLDGEVMAAIHEGRISQDQFLEWCRQTEAATGEKWLPEIPEGTTHSSQQVREAVTKIGEAYLAGRIRKVEQIAPGLRGIIRSLMEYFRHVLARAKVLREAIDAGKIDANFHSFLAQSVGLPEGDLVEQHATRTTAETVSHVEQAVPAYSVTLIGNEFGDNLPFADLRKKAKDFIHSLIGSEVTNVHNGQKIEFDKQSGKKPTSGPRKNEEIQAMAGIKEMLQNAEPVGTEADSQGRPDIKAWHKYEATAEISGKPHTFILKIREMKDGHFFYDSYTKKEGLDATSGTASPEEKLGNPKASSPTDNVAQTGEDRNSSSSPLTETGKAASYSLGTKEDMPDFYSNLERTLDKKIQGKAASPDQIRGMLNGSGIKAEEIKWSGIQDIIDRLEQENEGKVPKEALLKALADHRDGMFEERQLGKNVPKQAIDPVENPFYEIENPDGRYSVLFQTGPLDTPQEYGQYDTEAEAKEAVQNFYQGYNFTRVRDAEKNRPSTDPKFERYTLPGGENYREVILKGSGEASLSKEDEDKLNKTALQSLGKPFSQLDPSQQNALRSMLNMGKKDPGETYFSPHFADIPNYIAHMRVDERNDSKRRPGLFIQEIQSDRHQAGRDKGYKGEDNGKIPDAPFRKDWHLAMFKRALRDAVRTGKEWIGWTDGQTQADRYDLSKQVKSIAVRDNGNGTWKINVEEKNSGSVQTIDESAPTAKLSDIVGKELAEKIANGEGEPTGQNNEYRRFSDEGLKVGGEGMKGFYDQILPKEIGKYVKQWGGRVEEDKFGAKNEGYKDPVFDIPMEIQGRIMDEVEQQLQGKGIDEEKDPDAYREKFIDMQTELSKRWANENPKEGSTTHKFWKIDITPEMRAGVEAGQPAYSLTTKAEQDRLQAALEKHLNRSPEARLAVYERMRANLDRVIAKNNASMLELRDGRDYQISESEQNAEADRTARIADLHAEEQQEIRDALDANAAKFMGKIEGASPSEKRSINAQAKDRAAIIEKGIRLKYDEKIKAIENEARIQKPMADGREKYAQMIQSIGELEAVIKALPMEIRGKIGGYREILTKSTDAGRTTVLLKRIEMADKALEKLLLDGYDDQLNKILDRSKPKKNEPGEKPKGIGADIQRIFSVLKEARSWMPEDAQAHIEKLQGLIDKGEMTPEQEAHAQQEIGLVAHISDWKNADSVRRSHAIKAITNAWEKGYSEHMTRVLQKREAAEKKRGTFIKQTGTEGGAIERKNREKEDEKLRGTTAKVLKGLYSFDQLVHTIWGNDSKEATRLSDEQRKADNIKEDRLQARWDELSELFTGMMGNKQMGEELRYAMSQRSLDFNGLHLSELEALSATMMWMQEDGQRHMKGKMDDSGKVVSSWGYTQKDIDKLEAKLTPQGRMLREYLLKKYEADWHTLNAVFREENGMDLPRNKNYSPLRVKPQRTQGNQTVDPVTNVATSGMSTTPGSLLTRGSSIAEPEFLDVLQTYIAHNMQMEHYKAYAAFNRETAAVLRNRDLSNAVEAGSGLEARKVLGSWLDYFAQGGTRDAASSLAINQLISKGTGRAAQMALVGKIGTILVQSSQLTAAYAEMPTGSYVKRLSMLLTGNLDWSAAFNSPYIQRRIKELPPIARQAMDGLKSDKPTTRKAIMQYMGTLIGGADGLFTAGTYAMVYDYHLTLAKEMGMTGAEAEAHARNTAERATDRLAQPTRAGAKSLYENISMGNPLARLAFSFASESRKNIALFAYSMANRTPAEKARTAAFVFVLSGLVGNIIRSAWSDAKDDSDSETFDTKHWNWKRIAINTAIEPIQGIPVLGSSIQQGALGLAGIYSQNSDLLTQPVQETVRTAKHVPNYIDGTADRQMLMKDVDGILHVMGLFSSEIAAYKSMENLAKDIWGVGANAKKATTEEK